MDAYALAEVEDITEVLLWVDEHARGRRFELFAEMDDQPEEAFGIPRTSGLLRLLGSSPNAGESVEIAP